MKDDLPSWVSLQYVASHDTHALDESLEANATGIILDLEDFVPIESKTKARANLTEAARAVRSARKDVLVRINRPIDAAVADIRAAAIAGADALLITKVASPEHIKLLDEYLESVEAELCLRNGCIKLVPMIETLSAVPFTDDIATAAARIVGLAIGSEDLASELSVRSNSPTIVSIKERMIVSALRAGILPIGHIGSVKGLDSRTEYLEMLRQSRERGYLVATCLSADQATSINEAYAPTPSEVYRAQGLFENAPNVPKPVSALSRLVLSRADRVTPRIAIA
ncbi:hypothetical protein WQE_05222 [Paraburkholderia hospita]|uniref:HpcH/HpaI aldolase/citrate lyase domain-containing protein n=1 Tax=Paraburkholderia hospita TaxID=169430 RepID=A0ABN0FTX3_9BURK|nr:aldolase/citrate lyase family protein [Paraburkholderia hospita]EIN02209.1 hypothetical protein WQE_05222 [Paraburkholderia hospita]OUL90099.1 hypothetical protein CA602_07380 [Paraburkholderia hospita]